MPKLLFCKVFLHKEIEIKLFEKLKMIEVMLRDELSILFACAWKEINFIRRN